MTPTRTVPARRPPTRGIGCERCHGPAAITSSRPRPISPTGRLSTSAPSRPRRSQPSATSATSSATPPEMQDRREDPIWVRSAGATTTFSRCYTESQGGLSCLTCHDPHKDAKRSPAFYEAEVSVVPFGKFECEGWRDGVQGQPQPRLPDLPHAQGSHARSAHLTDRPLHSGTSGKEDEEIPAIKMGEPSWARYCQGDSDWGQDSPFATTRCISSPKMSISSSVA